MSFSLSRVPARMRFGVSLALSSALLLSCGGNPAGTTGSGAANLPPQTNPAVKDDAKDGKNNQGPRRTLSGTVLDALTGEPVAKAVMYIEGIETSLVSTPTPAASPDARDPIEGGGGGPFQLAQADPQETDPFDPEPAAPTLLSPAPGASGAPGAFGAPAIAGSPSASLAPGASPAVSPAAGAAGAPSPTGSASPGAAPTALATPIPLKTLKVDSSGKYELKDLPEGTYSITYWAPGYQAQTFQGALRSTLDVQLTPLALPKGKLHEFKGVVRQTNNDAAGGVKVEATSYKAQIPGAHTTSDDAGGFAIKNLLAGNYAVAAWTTNMEGEINAFALVKEVPVAVGKEKRTVSPTLVLRAVTSPLLLAGTVEGTDTDDAEAKDKKDAAPAKPKANAVKARTIRAYMRAGEGEIPIATANIGKDGYFRLRLPTLPEGVSYHLVASGATESGETVYVHRYGVTKSDAKVNIQLPDAPTTITVTERSKGPNFAWEATDSAVAAYRVSIEDIGQDGETLWEGWTTGTAIQLPNHDDFKLLKEGESYRYSLTAIKLEAGKTASDLGELASLNWTSSGLTKPATFEVPRQKGGKQTLSAPAKPVAKPVAPGAKPSATPTPKGAQRAKPMTDL